jgi:hypothetical protein
MRMAITGSITRRTSNPINEMMMSNPLYNMTLLSYSRKCDCFLRETCPTAMVIKVKVAAVVHFLMYDEAPNKGVPNVPSVRTPVNRTTPLAIQQRACHGVYVLDIHNLIIVSLPFHPKKMFSNMDMLFNFSEQSF